jgi:DNA-3-methyladenine glycosylase I
MGVERGPDGRKRCWWCLGAEDLTAYHDDEWGKEVRGDRELFERITLEAFQSGLSWLTILRKREGFRSAFAGWDFERVADYGAREVKRLMADTSIVRNRAKIDATIANARAVRDLRAAGETLTDLLWRFAPDADRDPPASGEEMDSITDESTAMAKELKRRGFAFVGPTTAYSTMQATGMVNDHLAGCEFR